MSESRLFHWTDPGLVEVDAAAPELSDVLAADSWLVDDGRVLALDVHRDRFSSAVGEQRHDLGGQAERFWDEAVTRIPTSGLWFPRLDLVVPRHDEPLFRLRLRPAPERRDWARLATARLDPRTNPRVKGPDLERLGALRATAARLGADEAVIVDSAGFIAEGAYSSVVWWRGATLCVVADEVPRLAGVTERALVTLAQALGIEVSPEIVTVDDLEGLEVWLLDSLAGIRIATSWLDGPDLAEEPGRLRLWRKRLAALTRPIAVV